MLEFGLIFGGWLGGMVALGVFVYVLMRVSARRERKRRARQDVVPLGGRRLP